MMSNFTDFSIEICNWFESLSYPNLLIKKLRKGAKNEKTF